jgi:murein L,D-transpeptidase YafK
MEIRRIHLLVAVLGLAVCAIPFRAQLRTAASVVMSRLRVKKTVADRLAEFEAVVRNRLAPRFQEIKVEYPPARMILAGLKHEKRLEVWVAGRESNFRLLKTYPILGASGTIGPKLTEGDGQVPEGFYKIESLNPNSAFHVALRVNYPNQFDRDKGKLDGRSRLGSDIMVHGNTCSVGCLAMGNEAAEELFALAANTGIENIRVILSPVDFRQRELPPKMPPVPKWTSELYADLRRELNNLASTNDFPSQGVR